MESLISLIHSLGLKVAADGIETGRQAERLKAAEL
jgi:EAL domain-containing protein (putative c-di-GMP-specific phosphodiesterase class I)